MKTRLSSKSFAQIQGGISGMQAKRLEAGEAIVTRASDSKAEITVINLSETSNICDILPCIGDTVRAFLGRIGIGYKSVSVGDSLPGLSVTIVPGRPDYPTEEQSC